MKRRRRWRTVLAVALLGLVAVILFSAAESGRGGAAGRGPPDGEWKDDWLQAWVKRQPQHPLTRPARLQPCPANASCAVPKHLPASRADPLAPQTVPRIIWQTWADNRCPRGIACSSPKLSRQVSMASAGWTVLDCWIGLLDCIGLLDWIAALDCWMLVVEQHVLCGARSSSSLLRICPGPHLRPSAQTLLVLMQRRDLHCRPLANQHAAMRSVIEANPEYEYLLFDDGDCRRFVCDLTAEPVQRVRCCRASPLAVDEAVVAGTAMSVAALECPT